MSNVSNHLNSKLLRTLASLNPLNRVTIVAHFKGYLLAHLDKGEIYFVRGMDRLDMVYNIPGWMMRHFMMRECFTNPDRCA